MFEVPIPLVYLSLLFPLLYLFRRSFLSLLIPRSIPGIPAYPDASPILGDIPRMNKAISTTKSFSYFFDKVALDLGPIAQVRASFFANFVVLTDYQEIESVLARHSQFDRASNTTDIFRTILPSAQISLPTNKMWRHHRRLVGTAMTSKYLAMGVPKVNEAIRNVIALLKQKQRIAKGRAFAVEHDMESGTMDAICAMAFGSSWGIVSGFVEQLSKVHEAPTGADGDAVFKLSRPALADSTWAIFETVPQMSLFPGLMHFFTRLTPRYRQHHKRLYDFFAEKVVASRQQAKTVGAAEAVETADNTLDLMVARELKGEDWMPENEMMDELYQYLLAGTETSGVTLSWWLKYMTTNPNIQRKLRQHILTRMPELQDRQPTFEDLNATNLPYLEAVVHEALRLSRTAGGYTREAKEDAIVLGRVVPKGTTIVMPTVTSYEDKSSPIYADEGSVASDSGDSRDEITIERSRRLGDKRTDPSSGRKVGFWESGTGRIFDPERWLDQYGNFDINAGPSLPFSLGQRSCFGKNLAMLELRLFMCQLSLAFFFAPVEDSQNSFQNYETVANHPLQCFIRPISWEDAPDS